MPKEERILIGKAFNSTLNVYKYPKKKWHPAQAKPLVVKSIKRVSAKRAKEERAYTVARAKYLSLNPICEMQVDSNCTHDATEVHHMKGRIGDLLTDPRYFKAGCHYCHHWVERHPKKAKEMGLSLSRLAKE